MLRKSMVLAGALAAAVLAGGCATGRGAAGAADDAAQPAADREARVRVSNNNWQDIDVYAVRDGTRVRLGTVTSMSEGAFRIPTAFLVGSSNVQLLIDPIGSTSGYLTQSILVGRGQTLDVRVENNLDLTSYSVW